MSQQRDISLAQYEKALKNAGIGPVKFMGYRNLGVAGQDISASELNGGPRRRSRLAYLLQAKAQNEKESRREMAAKSTTKETRPVAAEGQGGAAPRD